MTAFGQSFIGTVGSVASYVIADTMTLLRQSFPKTVRIETTNHCQADCVFCPRSTIGRAKANMKQDVFEAVVKQCVEGGTRLVHLHGYGEPLIDKQLADRIKYCKDQGIPRVKIFTNGDLLKGDLAKRILHSGLDEVKISIDGSDSQEFNKLRIGLDHSKVVENVKAFRKLRDVLLGLQRQRGSWKRHGRSDARYLEQRSLQRATQAPSREPSKRDPIVQQLHEMLFLICELTK